MARRTASPNTRPLKTLPIPNSLRPEAVARKGTSAASRSFSSVSGPAVFHNLIHYRAPS